MKRHLFLKIRVLQSFANFSGKHLRCRPSGLQLYGLQFKCFPVKFLRASFSTEQLWWLPFKIRNSNNLFKHVSAIFLTQNQSLITCNSHNDKLIWKCTHLPKTRVPIELLCSSFRTKSLPSLIWSKHNNLAVLF